MISTTLLYSSGFTVNISEFKPGFGATDPSNSKITDRPPESRVILFFGRPAVFLNPFRYLCLA